MSPQEKNERLEILEMIQQGKISSQEGLKLLEVLAESQEIEEEEYIQAKQDMLSEPQPLPGSQPELDYDPAEMENWRRWWVIPFWIGVGLTILGGALMYWAWAAHGIGLGFVAAWIPFLIGLGVMVLGWNSRTGPWLHLRIKQSPGNSPEKFSLDLPLPIRFFAWSIRIFGKWIPDLPQGSEELLYSLGSYSTGDPPLSINVDDEEDDQQVIIYIG